MNYLQYFASSSLFNLQQFRVETNGHNAINLKSSKRFSDKILHRLNMFVYIILQGFSSIPDCGRKLIVLFAYSYYIAAFSNLLRFNDCN